MSSYFLRLEQKAWHHTVCIVGSCRLFFFSMDNVLSLQLDTCSEGEPEKKETVLSTQLQPDRDVDQSTVHNTQNRMETEVSSL